MLKPKIFLVKGKLVRAIRHVSDHQLASSNTKTTNVGQIHHSVSNPKTTNPDQILGSVINQKVINPGHNPSSLSNPKAANSDQIPSSVINQIVVNRCQNPSSVSNPKAANPDQITSSVINQKAVNPGQDSSSVSKSKAVDLDQKPVSISNTMLKPQIFLVNGKLGGAIRRVPNDKISSVMSNRKTTNPDQKSCSVSTSVSKTASLDGIPSSISNPTAPNPDRIPGPMSNSKAANPDQRSSSVSNPKAIDQGQIPALVSNHVSKVAKLDSKGKSTQPVYVKVNTGTKYQAKTSQNEKIQSSITIETSINNERIRISQDDQSGQQTKLNLCLENGSLKTKGSVLKRAKEGITVIKWESPLMCNNNHKKQITSVITDDTTVRETKGNLDLSTFSNIVKDSQCKGARDLNDLSHVTSNNRKSDVVGGVLSSQTMQPVVLLEKLKVENDFESDSKSKGCVQGGSQKRKSRTWKVEVEERSSSRRKAEGCFVESSADGMFLKKAKMASDDNGGVNDNPEMMTDDGVNENLERDERGNAMKEDEEDIQNVIEANIEEILISEQTKRGEGFTYSYPYTCGICSYTAKLPHHMKNHMKTHTSNRPFVCEVCQKGFKFAHHLVGHKRTHSGERPYTCEDCGRGFTQISNMLRHKKTHQGMTEQNKHKCQRCNKHFSTAYSLRRHAESHKERKARVKMIKNKKKGKKDFTYNPTVDDELRKFQCDFCGRRFKRKEHVTRHLLTHTGESEFSCDVCGRGFSTKKSLVKHINIHTGDDFEEEERKDEEEDGSSSFSSYSSESSGEYSSESD